MVIFPHNGNPHIQETVFILRQVQSVLLFAVGQSKPSHDEDRCNYK